MPQKRNRKETEKKQKRNRKETEKKQKRNRKETEKKQKRNRQETDNKLLVSSRSATSIDIYLNHKISKTNIPPRR